MKRILPTSAAAEEYVPQARALLDRALLVFKASGHPIYRTFAAIDRAIIQITITSAKAEAIIITDDLRGFLSHARNGVVRGFQFPGTDLARTPTYGLAHTGKGYTIPKGGGSPTDDGDETGAQSGLPFPLLDGDGKSWHFSDESGSWKAQGPQEISYGNVDWKGPATDNPAARKILTYRGNPSRYWPVGQFTLIPGLSSIDHTIESDLGDYSYTTVFSEYVYEQGSVRAVMPYLYAPRNAGIKRAQVLGAAYRQSDGILVCIVKTCYLEIPAFEGHPGPGYFIEVLLEKGGDVAEGWTRALRVPIPAGMPNCNFFFSEDGSKACSVMYGQLHLISIDGISATYSTKDLGGFHTSINKTIVTDSEENLGDPDPAESGIFAAVYRVGVNSGDWIGKNETTRTYAATKSGELIIAADYKGDELVFMKAKQHGYDQYRHRRLFGMKWGYTALPGSATDDDRTPRISISVDPFDGGGAFTGTLCVSVTGACKPVVSLSGSLAGTSRADNPLCFDVSEPGSCGSPGSPAVWTVTATVVDTASGRSASVTKKYRDPRGHWATIFTYNGPYTTLSGSSLCHNGGSTDVGCCPCADPSCWCEYGFISYSDTGVITDETIQYQTIYQKISTTGGKTNPAETSFDDGMIGPAGLEVGGSRLDISTYCIYGNGANRAQYSYDYVSYTVKEWQC